MERERFTLISHKKIARDIWQMTLAGDTGRITRPGQFTEVLVPGKFLRRPISVADWDAETLTLVYKTVGEGTLWMTDFRCGERLEILTGLGNGFDPAAAGARPLLVGGGVGTPPMLGLARALAARGAVPQVVLGFGSADEVFFEKEFAALGCPVTVATADGSRGVAGFVTDALPAGFDSLFACGPIPMLQALAERTDCPAYFSMECRMGCGFGACMGCSVETTAGPRRVCKEGPVFRKEEILWQSFR